MRCRLCDLSGIKTNNSKFKEHDSLCKDCMSLCETYGIFNKGNMIIKYNNTTWA